MDLFPDIENELVPFIRAEFPTSEVKRVLQELPAEFESQMPIIQLNRGGGSDDPAFIATDRPILDVSVWAADRTQAKLIAEKVRRALVGKLASTNSGFEGGIINWVITLVGPRVVPDPNTNVRRVSASYELGVSPNYS